MSLETVLLLSLGSKSSKGKLETVEQSSGTIVTR